MEGTEILQEKKRPSTGIEDDNGRARLTVHIDGDIFDLIQECRIKERQRTSSFPTQSEFVEQKILRPWYDAMIESNKESSLI